MKIFDLVSYDPQADACYIQLSKNKVFETNPKGKDCFVDYDKNGEIVGVEYINASKHWGEINPLLFSNKTIAQCV